MSPLVTAARRARAGAVAPRCSSRISAAPTGRSCAGLGPFRRWRARASRLDGADAPPPSVRPEEAAVQLAPGQKTAISVGDFINLGSTLLVVWPSEETEKLARERRAAPCRA